MVDITVTAMVDYRHCSLHGVWKRGEVVDSGSVS